MNILIPDSWLREHLKTKATPRQIAEYLSLCSQSVEKINRVGEDWIYEVEVTTNRPDCLSVYGIARELAVILPRFGIKVSLVTRHSGNPPIGGASRIRSWTKPGQGFWTRSWTGQDDGQNDGHPAKSLPLEVKITNPLLCPRFTAIIFDNIRVAPSPKIVQERLEKVGIRALNNVVDISNYLMIELGQPMHTFDYDKIGGAKMILREAARGEKITTLDGQRRILPQGAIVIEDGKGKLIDLCGIMGGENSAVDEKTGRVLLFIQTYDPVRIRRTCQELAFRTEAASRFEKGVDPEGVISAIKKAIIMFEKNCGGKSVSELIDIYPNPQKITTINLDLGLVNKLIGIEISKNDIINILKSLGFGVLQVTGYRLQVTVPHWRYSDISISEDLIEEIARIYGYHNLPSNIPSLSCYRHSGLSRIDSGCGRLGRPYQNDVSKRFFWEEKVKTALKYWGFRETMSFSMVSEEMLVKVGLAPEDYLKIANPLTSDLVYMRPSLIPSILQIISQNQANFPEVRIFEIANIYIPQGEKSLAEEIPMLTAVLTGDRFYEAKGILEALFEDLGIKDYKFRKGTSINKIFHSGKMAEIQVAGKPIGILGEGNTAVTHRFDISDKVIIFDLEINPLISWATSLRQYIPIPVFPATVEDIAFVIYEKVETAKIIEAIKKVDKLIVKVSLLDFYHNTQTFRITYQSPTKTLTGEEVGKIREKIIKAVKEKFGVGLKS